MLSWMAVKGPHRVTTSSKSAVRASGLVTIERIDTPYRVAGVLDAEELDCESDLPTCIATNFHFALKQGAPEEPGAVSAA